MTDTEPLGWITTAGASLDSSLVSWDRGELAPLPVGKAWDVVRLPHRPGWRVVQHLQVLDVTTGPVLLTDKGIAFLVPPGSADDWDLPGADVFKAGAELQVPHPSVTAPHTLRAHSWIVPPQPGPVLALADADDLYGGYATVCAEQTDGAPL